MKGTKLNDQELPNADNPMSMSDSMLTTEQIKSKTIEILNAAEDFQRTRPNDSTERERLVRTMFENWKSLTDDLTDLGVEFGIEPVL